MFERMILEENPEKHSGQFPIGFQYILRGIYYQVKDTQKLTDQEIKHIGVTFWKGYKAGFTEGSYLTRKDIEGTHRPI